MFKTILNIASFFSYEQNTAGYNKTKYVIIVKV